MPDPVAASGEIVVDIVAASVNGADWKVREGKNSGQLSHFPGHRRTSPGLSFRPSDRASAICMSAMRRSASATSARKAPMPRRLRSRPPSSPGKNRFAVPCRCRRTGAGRVYGDLHRRRHVKTEGGRNDPGPGRRGRRRELCHPIGKAPGGSRDHHRKCGEP